MTASRPCGDGFRLAATLTGLLAAQGVLFLAGSALPSLPLERGGIVRSLSEADPLALAVSALRLVAMAVGAWLVATTVLGIVARTCGAVRLVVHLDPWTLPSMRRLLDGALGVGLATSIGLSALPAGAEPGGLPAPASTLRRLPDAPTTLQRLPDAPPGPPADRTPPSSTAAADSATTLRRLPDVRPAPLPTPGAAPSPTSVPPPVSRPPPTPTPSPAPTRSPAPAPSAAPAIATAPNHGPGAIAGAREVVVQPGDSFWQLAERHEEDRLGRAPTESEVGACWQELVAVNRHRLAVPEDADLLFPGQVLVIPCP